MAKAKLADKAWFNSLQAVIGSAVAGLLLAYAFVSRALDTGSYWQYLAGLAFLVLSVKLGVRAIKK